MRRPKDLAALLPDVVEIAEEAGAAVLVVYAQNDYAVREKAGRGPVTRADLAAHDLLVARLGARVPDIRSSPRNRSRHLTPGAGPGIGSG